MRTARCASARPARASSPARWGSSEPWIAWKSCSGARAISSTLNTKPATAASSAVRSVVSTAALSSVCSASMIASTANAKRPPRARPSSSPPRARRAPAGGRRRERERDDDQRDERRGGHAERDRGLALRDPDRDREREQQPRRRLEEHEPAVEPEPLVPGQPAAREVARRVGEHGDDEDPVQRRRAVEQPVLDRPAQRERDERGRRARSRPGSAAATRSGWSCSSPRARRSAIVRESSCSIGR